MTVSTPKKKKGSSMRPRFVSDDTRRQFLSSHMTPYIAIQQLIPREISNLFSMMPKGNDIDDNSRSAYKTTFDVARFCRDRFPDYVEATKKMDYPQIEFWLELHRRGFRMTNIHLQEYKERFSGHSNSNYLHYGIGDGNRLFDSNIHIGMYILLFLEQGYDFTNFIQKLKDIRFDEQSTVLTREGTNRFHGVHYMSVVGFDISNKMVEPVIDFKYAASYGQAFLFRTSGVAFVYGSPTPSLLKIERDAPVHLFTEGDAGTPVLKDEYSALVYSINIFVDEDKQPVYADVETWFKLTEEGLAFDYMLRNYHHLLVTPETVYHYHTRTGMPKESDVPKRYAPKHEYGSIHLHMKDSHTMIKPLVVSSAGSYIYSPDFLNHPAYKYSGVDTLLPSRPQALDPDLWYHLDPLRTVPKPYKEEFRSWSFKVSQFFLREKSPFFIGNMGASMTHDNHVIENDTISNFLLKTPMDEWTKSNQVIPVLEFFQYYAANPAIEQVLKDRFLHGYGGNLISLKRPLPNPHAKSSLEAVGLDRAVLGVLKQLEKIRQDKLPAIKARYQQNERRNRPVIGQPGRRLSGYHYNVRATLEESFSNPNFVSALTSYFERCEGPGQAFLNVYEEYLDYVLEVLPTNLPSLSSILSSCSMEFVINGDHHRINILFSQYLSYMRHGVQYQALDFNEFHNQFKDYLSMKVQVHGHTDFEYYPRPSIRLAHDLALRDFNLIRHEHDRKSFDYQVSKYAELYTYEPDNEDYIVIPPENPEDVIEEGRNLRHCVGSYVSRITDGRSYIMFLRHKETPDESYATIEINDNNQITQVQGSVGRNRFNQSPAVEAFLNRYRTHLGQLTMKPSMIVKR